MPMVPMVIEEFTNTLRENEASYGVKLADSAREKLSRYYELLLKWNPRLHLVAPCSAGEFANRHVLESLMLVRHLSRGARVADVGSGAGLPIIPCLIAREDIRATLIESSTKKAVFLREVLRASNCELRANILAEPFQDTTAPDYDFVTCRALDRFDRLLPALIEWTPPGSTLLLFAGEDLVKKIRRILPPLAVEKLPNSERRFLVIAQRADRISGGNDPT